MAKVRQSPHTWDVFSHYQDAIVITRMTLHLSILDMQALLSTVGWGFVSTLPSPQRSLPTWLKKNSSQLLVAKGLKFRLETVSKKKHPQEQSWQIHPLSEKRDRYSVAVVTNDIFTREDAEFLNRSFFQKLSKEMMYQPRWAHKAQGFLWSGTLPSDILSGLSFVWYPLRWWFGKGN